MLGVTALNVARTFVENVTHQNTHVLTNERGFESRKLVHDTAKSPNVHSVVVSLKVNHFRREVKRRAYRLPFEEIKRT